MRYRELSGSLDLTKEQMLNVFGGVSDQLEFRRSDPNLEANGGNCHNINQCAKLAGYQSIGDAFKGLGVNPGDINQQNLTWDDVMS